MSITKQELNILHDCQHAQKTGTSVSLDEALNKGLEPCKVYKP